MEAWLKPDEKIECTCKHEWFIKNDGIYVHRFGDDFIDPAT